jgi:hypothetical protein
MILRPKDEHWRLLGMRSLVSRLALAALLSTFSAAMLVPSAMGWASNNNCTTTAGACVSRDDNRTTPRAVTCCTDPSYIGDLYYNTQETINETVSSVENKFTNVDIIWFTGINSSGTAKCVDSTYWIDDLGWFGFGLDDQFSSHAVQASDSPC